VAAKVEGTGVHLSVGEAAGERILLGLALLAFVWLAGGLLVPLMD
jgi:hypothetical protein